MLEPRYDDYWDRRRAHYAKVNRRRSQANNANRRHRDTLLIALLGSCPICGESLSHPIEIDHVVPVILGGDDSAENLRVVHRKCNDRGMPPAS